MELIQTITLTGSAASIEFTSIPNDGTDLLVLCSLRNADGFGLTIGNWFVDLNSSGTGSKRSLWGTGGSVQSYTASGGEINGINASSSTANTFSNHAIYIPNYAGSANKSISIDNVSENNATSAYQVLTAGLWSNSAAVTSVKIRPEYGTLVANSTASLYKITKA